MQLHDLGSSFAPRTLAVIGLVFASTIAAADDIYWVGYQNDCMVLYPESASFFHGDNWFNFLVPGPGDAVLLGTGFDPGGGGVPRAIHFGDFCVDVFRCPSAVIYPAGTAQSARLEVQDGQFLFDFGPGSTPVGSCAPEVEDFGRYEILGEDEPLHIGTVVQTTGQPGNALLEVKRGVLEARYARIAYDQGSTGALVVRGDGAQARFLQFPDIGYRGDGLVVVEDGGLLTSGGWMAVGVLDGSVGTLRVNGPRSRVFAEDWIDVGYIQGARGVMHIESGATVDARIPVAGAFPGSTGEINISGSNSTLIGREGILIGREASGSLVLTSNGQATTPLAIIGDFGSASGRVVIANAARLTTQGNLIIGNHGTGEVRVGAGGILEIEAGSSGFGRLSIADQPGSVGVLTASGGGASVILSGDLVAGVDGQASIDLRGGARLAMSDVEGRGGILTLANGPDAAATLAIRGTGTLVESAAQALVGDSGSGTLQILNGATMRSTKLRSPTNSSGIIGTGASGRGDVMITGPGSAWLQDGAMSVGFGGTGTLTLSQGGALRSQSGYVARFGASRGLVDIRDPGSQWNVDEQFYLGGNETGASRGEAILRVRGGGQVRAGGVTLRTGSQIQVIVSQGLPPMIDSAGPISLGGRLEVILDPGYEPTPGDRIQIIAAPSVALAFEEVILPTPGSGAPSRLVIGTDGVYVVFGCRADLDADGSLSIFDFLAFQNLFATGDLAADFDGDGSLTIFDFLAFQNAFDAGCP